MTGDNHFLIIHDNIPFFGRELSWLKREWWIKISVDRNLFRYHLKFFILLNYISWELDDTIVEDNVKDGWFLNFKSLVNVLDIIILFDSEFGGDWTYEFIQSIIKESMEGFMYVYYLVPLHQNLQ